MFEALLPLLLILCGFYVWHAALKAREQARAICQELCARARVQLLDQSVALQRIGFGRSEGRLCLRRHYRFEISTDGLDRHFGTLEILDGSLQSHSLPFAETAPFTPASNVIELHPRAAPTRH